MPVIELSRCRLGIFGGRVLGAAMFSILLLLATHQGIFYIMEFLCCEIYEPFFPVYNISFVFHPTTRDVSFLDNCIVFMSVMEWIGIQINRC